jgi:hypothetical protein
MSSEQVIQAIDRILALQQHSNLNFADSASARYRFTVLSPVPWNKSTVEATFQVTISSDLETLWNSASALDLFQLEGSISPTGVSILSPYDLVEAQEEARTVAFPQDLLQTDLVIGVHKVLYDFRIVIRCDPAIDDFGFVFVTQELDERAEWVYAAESLGDFLLRYLDAAGAEYWHTGEEPHVRS